MNPSAEQIKKIAAVILAAGDGKRMESTTPKVMSLLHGRPLIDYAVSAVESAGIFNKIIIVVSKRHTLVQDYIKSRASYVIQEEQLGTGHAVAATMPALREGVSHVLVLYGDMPFISSQSIVRLAQKHSERQNVATLMTALVPDFFGIYAPFNSFGRVVRREDGHIARIVEIKDCTHEEAKIREVNTSFFCFAAPWLWAHVNLIENNNAQKEYYLVDLIKMAIDNGERISSISVSAYEAIGVNTKADLNIASTLNLRP